MNMSYYIRELLIIIPMAILAASIKIIYNTIKAKANSKENIAPSLIPDDVPYYRDISFHGDFLLPFYAAKKEGIMEEKGLISAFILKWLLEKRITFIPIEKEAFDLNKNDNFYIDISNLETTGNLEEDNFIKYLRNASDGKKVSLRKFKYWCISNSGSIKEWYVLANKSSKQKLIDEGYIIDSAEEAIKRGLNCSVIYTDKLIEELTKLKGLKRYLSDMSLLDEKLSKDVHLWETYLIFASMFGIANKTFNQLDGGLSNLDLSSFYEIMDIFHDFRI